MHLYSYFFFFGMFQYGLLHLGQIIGSSFILTRGIHSCLHRSHLNPGTLTIILAILSKKVYVLYKTSHEGNTFIRKKRQDLYIK